MEIEIASLTDIDGILALQCKYHVSTIDAAAKKDGFVTTLFSREQLTELIETERGLFIARVNSIIVAYAMAASWGYWRRWPIFAYMIDQLPSIEFAGQRLSTDNSYQYGPICIDVEVRGSGVLEQLFAFALRSMEARFPVLVTFINATNTRSFAAHTRKLKLTVLTEFQFNNNNYYWLACRTQA